MNGQTCTTGRETDGGCHFRLEVGKISKDGVTVLGPKGVWAATVVDGLVTRSSVGGDDLKVLDTGTTKLDGRGLGFFILIVIQGIFLFCLKDDLGFRDYFIYFFRTTHVDGGEGGRRVLRIFVW